MHVTFGVESAVSGTYESLLHHALEVAAVDHPHLFGLSPQRGEVRRLAVVLAPVDYVALLCGDLAQVDHSWCASLVVG